MFKGATSKRFNFFFSAVFRFLSFVGLLIAYIVVKIAVRPQIDWLNALLITLSILSLITAIYNLVLCGFTATAYRSNFAVQFICFLVTMVTGGIASTTFTGIAVFSKVTDEEIKNEKIFNTKTFENKEGYNDEKTKR